MASPRPIASLPARARDSRLGQVLANGKLRVCTTGDYRPYTYKDPDTGQYKGIDVDMAKSLGKALGVPVQWVPTTWKSLMQDFTSSCDVAMGGISVSPERAEQAYFSTPTMKDGKTPITLCKNKDKFDTVEKINRPGVRSIMPEGGTNQKFADEHYPRGKRIVFGDNNKIFDEIIDGRADVMTTDASETVWVAHEHPELCAVHPRKPFNFSEKAYLLPLGDDVFQQYVDQWLRIAMNDGTYEKAKREWFGKDSGL